MSNQPYLYIPRPTARPGEAPDFSYLNLSPAGAVERPPIDARAGEIEHLALGLVRVLDDDHVAQGPWDPKLDKDTLVRALRLMVLTRAYDDRMQRMQRQGKITFYMQALGEEAVSIGQGLAFEDGDMMFPAYRNQGLYIMRDTGLVEMMCQCLSNSRDMCKGRQMPIFYQNAKKNLFTISGNLATQYPHAVGWAMGAAIKGEPNIAASWVGDGSTAEADFHYALTFAAVYNAPVILNVTNNQWAISVPLEKQTASETIAVKAAAYGMPGVRVDGNDVLAVYRAVKEAVDRARSGEGPTLLELLTYRRGPHSSSDDPTRYRGNQADEWLPRDPILRFRKYLELQDLWSEEQEQELTESLKSQINEAVARAEKAPAPGLDSLFSDVYAKVPPHLREQYEDLVEKEGEGHEPDPDAAFPL